MCLIASLFNWLGRAMMVPIVAALAIWLNWSSSDQRNMFGILPAIALCATAGAARLSRLRPRNFWLNGVTVAAVVFVVLAGSGLLKATQATIGSVAGGDRPLHKRLAAMRGSVPDKVALFYPQLEPDYRFMSALAQLTDAAHVLVTSPLFRFFERGAHALSRWPYEQVEPGDLFAAHEWLVPPDDPRWVLVHRGTTAAWLRVPGLRGCHGASPAGSRPRRKLRSAARDLRGPTAGLWGAGRHGLASHDHRDHERSSNADGRRNDDPRAGAVVERM